MRILEAAREAFAASGDASLNSIAKKAGVGPGTLYRHFPNREALVLAVYRYDVQQLADSAAELLSEHEPLRALRLWFDRLTYYGMIKHGLADALHAATSDGLAGETYGPVIGAITVLLTACARDGSIRPGIDPDDVLLLLGFLWRIDPGPDADARAARLLDLIVDGLKTGAPQPGHPGGQAPHSATASQVLAAVADTAGHRLTGPGATAAGRQYGEGWLKITVRLTILPSRTLK